MGMPEMTWEYFIAQWTLGQSKKVVYLSTFELTTQKPLFDRGTRQYSAVRSRAPFDVRELYMGLPIDLATWLHRKGAWNNDAMP